MKKIIIVLSLLVSALFCEAQTYYTGWDNPAEQAGWTEYRVGPNTGLYDWEYEINATISPPTQLVHYYPVGGTTVTDDWFVSPVFNFVAGGSIDSLMYKFLGFGTPMAGDTIAIYLLNGSADPSQATSKQLLKIYEGADYQNDNMWRQQLNIPIPSIAGDSYIAFRYKTIINWLDVKYDNLNISYNFPASIKNNFKNSNALILYPNPTNGDVTIKLSDNQKITEVSLYDMYGKLIPIEFNQGVIKTEGLSSGLYFIKAITAKGSFTKQLVVE